MLGAYRSLNVFFRRSRFGISFYYTLWGRYWLGMLESLRLILADVNAQWQKNGIHSSSTSMSNIADTGKVKDPKPTRLAPSYSARLN